jgi:hypothetical protein
MGAWFVCESKIKTLGKRRRKERSEGENRNEYISLGPLFWLAR